jgi:hypothetical protein
MVSLHQLFSPGRFFILLQQPIKLLLPSRQLQELIRLDQSRRQTTQSISQQLRQALIHPILRNHHQHNQR